MSSDQRFAVLLTILPLCAAILGWFLRRLIRNYDKAMQDRQEIRDRFEEERQARLARHTEKNNQAIIDLNTALIKSTRDLSDRMVAVQQEMSEVVKGLAVKVARLEGREEGAQRVWDGLDRRTVK